MTASPAASAPPAARALHHEIRGAGPDLVLLHGWAMHAGIFAPLVERLESQFTLHLIDLPGHGRSRDAGIPLTLDAAAAATAALVPEPAIWLGWSLGGLVALEAAARFPAQVRGLVALAASPRFVRADGWEEGMPAAVFHGFAQDLRRDYRGTLDRFLMLEAQGSAHMRDELRLLRAEVFAHGEPAAEVLCDGLEILEGSDLRATLPALAMPSLWIAGRRDRLVNPAAMRAAADAAPSGAFHLVASGGHAPFLTEPDEVANAIGDFAAELPR
jgi:pimeloyl-[acyl-carrier protein] methyl ester esterase